MAIKAGKVVKRAAPPKKDYVELTPAVVANNIQQKDKKIKAEDKPKIKIKAEDKIVDKKIRAEDKKKAASSVKINKPVQSSQSSTREILKPSRYVEDLMR